MIRLRTPFNALAARLRWFVGAALAAWLACTLAPAGAVANHTQESIFQDDQYLLDSSTTVVNQTLLTLKSLGVQRVRVNVLWSSIAPDPLSRKAPAHFVGANPADYPSANWAPYDRLVELATEDGLGVDFTVSAPGPLWAMGRKPVTAHAANHWTPSVNDFYDFMLALGSRYSGFYGPSTFTASSDARARASRLTLPISLPGLTPAAPSAPAASGGIIPAVDYWAIWNEPDQPGWLAPQWRKYKRKWVMNSPRLYREFVAAAYLGLGLSGHTTNNGTILIGELAPEGYTTPGSYVATTPMPFLRALYCVNNRYKPLRGDAATALGCHRSGSRKQFVQDDPLLFSATGFAHHPYYFFHTPSYSTSDPNFVPLADIGRLGRALNRIYRTYRVHRTIPLYFTEYGYETNPPDPHRNITPDQQAAFLNEADYMSWRNARVRSVAQFLLYDSPPNPAFSKSDPEYWDTFQTGLLFANGTPKPALAAYRMPIWIPKAKVGRHAKALVWGQLRAAPRDTPQTASIQWRGRRSKGWSTIASVSVTNPEGYFTDHVRFPGSGEIQISWQPASGSALTSRTVPVTVR